MQWQNVEMRYLKLAMKECEKVGLPGIRTKYGFQEASKVHMFHGECGPFEARALVAVAFSKQYPTEIRLTPSNFRNDDAHKFLEEFGFIRKAIIQCTAELR